MIVIYILHNISTWSSIIVVVAPLVLQAVIIIVTVMPMHAADMHHCHHALVHCRVLQADHRCYCCQCLWCAQLCAPSCLSGGGGHDTHWQVWVHAMVASVRGGQRARARTGIIILMRLQADIVVILVWMVVVTTLINECACMLWWSLVSVRGDQRARALSICGLWWWSGEMEVIEGWSQSKGCRWASSHCVFMGRCCCPQCCVSVCCRRYWHQWCSMVAVTICGQHHHHCCGSRQQMGIVIVELVGSLCTQLCSVVIWQPNPWPPFPYHYPQVARPIALLLGCITSHQVVLHQVALHQVISGLFGALSLPTVCFPSCTLSLLLFLRRFSLCLHTCLFSCCHSDPGHFTLTLAPPWPCHYIAVMLVLALSFLLFPLGAWYLFPSVHYIAL